MPLSAAEKKRRSRARKPAAYHVAEREASRKRMAMNRARNRAQKRAREIKSILSQEDKEAFEARAHEEKKRLLRDWFHRNGMRFEPKVMEDDKILHAFMTKRELCEIDLKVAEFEISMFRVGVGREFYNASGLKKDDKKIASKSRVTKFEISTVRVGLRREFYDASGLKKDNEKITAKSHKIDPSEHNLNNQIDRLSEKEIANGNAAIEIMDEEQEATTKLAYPGKNSTGVLSELEQNFKKEVVPLLEKKMTNGNEVIEILNEEREDKTEPAYSVKNGVGVSSDREEDCISWEDEIAAAKAMAIMQLMRRETKPANDVIAPGAKVALQGAPQARTAKEKGKILAKNASANAKIKARILHKVALAAGPSAADAMRGGLTQAVTDKAKIPGTQIRPRSGASHGAAGSKKSFPTRYSDGAPIIAETAAAQRKLFGAAA